MVYIEINVLLYNSNTVLFADDSQIFLLRPKCKKMSAISNEDQWILLTWSGPPESP